MLQRHGEVRAERKGSQVGTSLAASLTARARGREGAMIVSDSRWDEVVAGRVYPRDQRVTTRVNIKEILRDLKKRANLIARAVRFLIG